MSDGPSFWAEALDLPPGGRRRPPAVQGRGSQIAEGRLLQKRTEVCENHAGTFFTTLESAAFLTATLQEDVVSRCCCGVDAAAAPHGTIRLPAPASAYALNFFSGPNKPRLKALGMHSYQYLWDRLGADVDLSRCAALPGIQLLPSSVIQEEVNKWCSAKTCPQRRNNSDCAPRARPCSKRTRDDATVAGAALTIFVVTLFPDALRGRPRADPPTWSWSGRATA